MIQDIRIAAIAGALSPDSSYNWRKLCRVYSEMFSTPLHVVMFELPTEFVVRQVIERNVDVRLEEDEEEFMAYAQEAVGGTDSEEELIQEQVRMFEEQDRKKREKRRAAGKKQPTFRNRKVELEQKKAAQQPPRDDKPDVVKKFDMGDPDEQ